jgi:hypothetical protein
MKGILKFSGDYYRQKDFEIRYRIDEEQMNVEEITKRTDIYDILTHLTFIFIESHKIRNEFYWMILVSFRDWFKTGTSGFSKEKLTLKRKLFRLRCQYSGRTI